MKKVFALALAVILTVVFCAGCADIKTGNRIVAGKDVQTFNYAYIRLGDDNIVQGYVTQWRDYDDSDVVQVLLDGKFYLTHYTNVILIADPSLGSLQYSNPAMWGGEE